MKWLVTGGAGYLGSLLAQRLVDNGEEVTLMDIIAKHSAWRLSDVLQDVEYRWQSVMDVTTLPYDLVVHLAAVTDVPFAFTSPRITTYTNIQGTQNLLEVLRKSERVRKFIYMSSESVYGVAKHIPITEEEALRPGNVYGASKAAADMLTQTYYRCFECPTNVVRSSSLYGPGTRLTQVIPLFILQALQNKAITVEGTGEQTRDFNYGENLIDALLLVAEKGELGEVYNVASGKETSIMELAEKVVEYTGQGEITHIPWRGGEKGTKMHLSTLKIRKLGYFPKVDFDTGLKKTIEWIKTLGDVELWK